MSKLRVLQFAAVVAVVVAADQITKGLVRSSFVLGESRPLIGDYLQLTYVHNTGAAFGMLSGQQALLVTAAASVFVVVGLIMWRMQPASALARLGLAMVAGGAVGNLIDRIVFGGVTDFFDVGWWPVFNIADISLDVGVALLVWWLLFDREHRTDRLHAQEPLGDDGGAGSP